MKYTDEQKKILRESFAEADITSGIAKGSPKLNAADAKKYKALKKLVRGYLTSDLGEADINRNLGNFSADYPINLLVNTDAGIIAEKATQIMSSESRCLKLRCRAIARLRGKPRILLPTRIWR